MCLALATVIPRIHLVDRDENHGCPSHDPTTLVPAAERKLQSSPALPGLRLTGCKTKLTKKSMTVKYLGWLSALT
jgi:hypothetical protein